MHQNWIPLENIDFDNEAILHFHIETRYWTVLQHDFVIKIDDYPTFKKYPGKFFLSTQELKDVLFNWFVNSGARKHQVKDFALAGDDYRLKEVSYIRIYRVAEGFIVCNTKNKAFNKELLQSKVKYPIAVPLPPPRV